MARPEKIAPGLWSAVEATPSANPHLLHVASMRSSSAPEPQLLAFIKCDRDADLGDLASRGIEVSRTSNAFRAARIPLSQLDDLTEDGRISRIAPSRTLKPLMNVAPGVIGLPNLRSAAPGGLGGKDVVVGVVDSGIDSTHPFFAGRIHTIWDHTLAGPGVSVGSFSASYGRELSGATLGLSTDTNGHGTHVAGIAAGDDPTLGGIAPQATLVIVKTNFQTTSIADGVEYVFAVADSLGKPAVVNLSLGGHWDAHDGTDDLSLAIDNMVGPGKIVVCAAGNEGNDPIHSAHTVSAGQTASMRFSVPAGESFVAVNLWYPGATQLEVAVADPSGAQTPFQAIIPIGSFQTTQLLGGAVVSISTPGPNPLNGDHQVEILLQPPGFGSVTSGVWRVLLRHGAGPSARAEAWVLSSTHSAVFAGTSIVDELKVGSPGCCLSAITVGSFTSKDQWTDVTGALQAVSFALNDITLFSSQGPLRAHSGIGGSAQREKPDVVVPGAAIASALSAASSPPSRLTLSSSTRIMFGTSMASPIIAGIVAALLGHNPTLTPHAAKAWLGGHAKIPGQPSGAFDPQWGLGLVQIPPSTPLP